jgi:hypothetical protein
VRAEGRVVIAVADIARTPGMLSSSKLLSGAGSVRLPEMTTAELCVLGAMSNTLFDSGAWAWWMSTPPERRPALNDKTWKVLAARDLVAPSARRRTRVRVAPAAAMIVAARTEPAFIVLRRAGRDGEPEPTRMYGIADQRGLRRVLIEEATAGSADWAGPAYGFQLASPDEAARVLTRWATGPGPERGAGPGEPQLIDVHRPGSRDPRPAQRIRVEASGAGWHVSGEPGRSSAPGPLQCDQDALTRMLLSALVQAGRWR